MIGSTRKSLPHRLLRDNAGTGVMELALALPVLLLLLLGTIDTSRMIADKLDMEQAAQRTTDYALAKRPDSSNGTYLQNEAASAAGVPTSDVTVDIWLECDGVRQTDFSTACAAGQQQARYASVTIDKPVATLFNWSSLASFFGSKVLPASVTVQGDSVVRFQ
jgi:Flp pilus assembly protein TadG